MAVCRGVGWQELVRPAVVPGDQNRRVGQQPCQIAVRIQPTFFRRFNHAVDHGAAPCAPRRVGEEKILPANHKGFYGTFGKVVAQLQPSVLQYTDQIRPLFLQIQSLDPVSPPPTEQEQCAGERVKLKLLPDDGGKAIDPAPQVGITAGNVDFICSGEIAQHDFNT